MKRGLTTQMTEDKTSPPPLPALPRRKKLLFITVAMLIPIGLIVAVELVLRAVTDHGGYPPTILEIGQRGDAKVCITNRRGPAAYFFANKSQPGSIDTYTFESPKPKGTIRIFLAGGSAIKGFPQPMGFAPSAFLQAMLSEVWPDRRVEVINLGTTAVASFPVLGMVTEALEYEPDLIVVYSGHNEFFGAYGVASLHRAGNSPTAMKLHRSLRRSALVQWIDSFARPGVTGEGQRTLMELMVGQSYTAADDPIRDAAARNLKANIGEIIARAQARGVPVMVCTLASNERDLAPLGAEDLSHLSTTDQGRVTAGVSRAESALKKDDLSAAEAAAAEVLSLAPSHARAHYLHGRALYQQTRYDEAAAAFAKAIEMDPMPWRCTERSMQAIRESAKADGVILCDIRRVFREASPGGCIGWELMDDHVHPSLAGQSLVARAIVQALTAVKGPLAVDAETFAKLPEDEVFAERLGDNVYDRYGVAHTIRVLCRIPFIRKTNPEAYERFDVLCEQLLRGMPSEVADVCRKWQDPATHPGAKRPITSMVGRVMVQIGRYRDGEKLYQIALRSVATYSSWNLDYSYFVLVCRERSKGGLSAEDMQLAAECIERGRFLLAHGQSSAGLTERYVGRLHQLRGEWEEAVPFLEAARTRMGGMDLVVADQALVMSYVRLGRHPEAEKLIENGIAQSGEYSGLYRQMRGLLEGTGTVGVD